MRDSDTWQRLIDAHQRAATGPLEEPPAHRPTAAILACSDARVPPSVVFDQPAGRLFVVRIAGNTASPTALASLDYAVAELGVELLVVLGHTGCGAVTAAATGTCDGYLAPLVEPICRIARNWPGADVDELVARNVENTIAVLAEHAGPAGTAIRRGTLDVRGAVHDLRLSRLDLLHPLTNPLTAKEAP